MNLALVDKKVLITGSSRGIGLAIANSFLREGANVVLTSRNRDDLDNKKNLLMRDYPIRQILTYVCDFTIPDDINRLNQQIQSVWAELNILIINVGSGISKNDPIPDLENFQKVFKQNFDSAVYTVREFLPLVKETKGNILFIASIVGLEAFGAPTDYSVAKSAMISFAKNLARKVAQDEVRVNIVAPGNIFLKGGSWDGKLRADPERVKSLIITTVPMQRFGRPEEVADSVVFLASERSSFTTGACLIVDGGQTMGIF